MWERIAEAFNRGLGETSFIDELIMGATIIIPLVVIMLIGLVVVLIRHDIQSKKGKENDYE